MTECGNEVVEEDGWEYWGKVYADPVLSAQNRAKSFEEPSIAQLLSRAKLRRTRIVMENLERMTSEAELKNLLEAELGKGTVHRGRMGKGGRALVEFYLEESARKAIAIFDQRKIRGRNIRVLSEEEAEEEEEGVEEDEKEPKIRVRLDDDDEATQSNLERGRRWEEVERSFVAELVDLLRRKGPLEWNGAEVTALLRKQLYSPLVVFRAWPLGAFRRSRKEIKLIGPFLALHSQEKWAQKMCVEADRGYMEVEAWESQNPGTITDLVSFYTYLRGFVERWGPVWLWNPVMVEMLDLLPAHFHLPPDVFSGRTAHQMHIKLLDDTLYLVSVPDQNAQLNRLMRNVGE